MLKGSNFEDFGGFRFDLLSGDVAYGASATTPHTRCVRATDIRIRAELLLCALIDNLRFMYDITEDNFSALMAPASRCLFERAVVSGSRLLRSSELDEVLEIANAVTKASGRIVNNHQSLITLQDRDYIITNVMEPARALNVDPRYIIEQLHDLNIHQWHTANLKDTFLYASTSSRFGHTFRFLNSGRKQTLLAKRLVSDDITIANLNARIGDQLRIALGSAIAKFDKQYCGSAMGSVDREIYVDRVSAKLAMEMEKWEVMAQRENNTQGCCSIPFRAEKPMPADNIPPVPPLPRVIPKIHQASLTTMPVSPKGSPPEKKRVETDSLAMGVRVDDEEPDSLLVEYQPDVEAPAQPHPSQPRSRQPQSTRIPRLCNTARYSRIVSIAPTPTSASDRHKQCRSA